MTRTALSTPLPRPPDIDTSRLRLRELRSSDASSVAVGAGDRRVAQYLIQVPSPYPIALARRWVMHRIAWWEMGRGITYAVSNLPPQVGCGRISVLGVMQDGS